MGNDHERQRVDITIHLVLNGEEYCQLNGKNRTYMIMSENWTYRLGYPPVFRHFTYKESGTSENELWFLDETEYYYDEYITTVGEIRNVMQFADSTPDNSNIYLRIYCSAEGVSAYSIGTENEMLQSVWEIYEISQAIPEKFTFEIPSDYEPMNQISERAAFGDLKAESFNNPQIEHDFDNSALSSENTYVPEREVYTDFYNKLFLGTQ